MILPSEKYYSHSFLLAYKSDKDAKPVAYCVFSCDRFMWYEFGSVRMLSYGYVQTLAREQAETALGCKFAKLTPASELKLY